MQGGRLCFGDRSQYDLGQSSVTLFPLFCLVFGNIQYLIIYVNNWRGTIQYQIIYVKHWRGTTQYQIIYANHLRGNKQYQINISVAANLALSFFHTCFKIFKIALCMCCVVFNPKVFRYSKNLFANCTFRGCLQTWRWLTLSVDKKYKQGNNVVFKISHHFYYIKIRIKIDINTKVNFNIENQTINNISINIFTSIQWVFSSAKAHILKSSLNKAWLSQWLTTTSVYTLWPVICLIKTIEIWRGLRKKEGIEHCFGKLSDKSMLTAWTHALNVPGHRGKSQLRGIRHSGQILTFTGGSTFYYSSRIYR